MSKEQPLVSVIIPTFNRDKFIGAAIESVLEQTFKDFEIIVVDDGSTDQTPGVVKSFSNDKLIYVHQPNRGRSNARNHALSLAKGRYIAFLDSDDLYLPNKLELQVGYMADHPEAGMVYTSAYCVDERGAAINYDYKANASGWIYEDIAFYVPVTITLPTVMVRREVFERVGYFDEQMERFEDTDMWRRISKYFPIGAISDPTCKLRTHAENSLQRQDPQKIIQSLTYYANKILSDDASVSIAVRRKGIATLFRHYGQAMMTNPSWVGWGRGLVVKSISYWPYSAGALLTYLFYPAVCRFRQARERR